MSETNEPNSNNPSNPAGPSNTGSTGSSVYGAIPADEPGIDYMTDSRPIAVGENQAIGYFDAFLPRLMGALWASTDRAPGWRSAVLLDAWLSPQ